MALGEVLTPTQWRRFNRAHKLYYSGGTRMKYTIQYAIQHKIEYIGYQKDYKVFPYYSS